MDQSLKDVLAALGVPSNAASADLRVRFGETDAMGIVYYANYIDWFASGRTELLRAAGYTYKEAFADAGLHLPAIEAHCNYKSPAVYDDLVHIVTWVEAAAPARIRFQYKVVRHDGTLLAEGYTVHAFTNLQGKPLNLQKKAPELYRALQGLCAGKAN